MEQNVEVIGTYAPLLVMAALFYFMLYRPQKKQQARHADMLASLTRGKRVITKGGILGTVYAIKDHTSILEVSEGVNIEISKLMIAGEYLLEDSEPAESDAE